MRIKFVAEKTDLSNAKEKQASVEEVVNKAVEKPAGTEDQGYKYG